MNDTPYDDSDQGDAIDELIDAVVTGSTQPALQTTDVPLENGTDARNDVDIVIRGNMPVGGFIWPPQYVKRLALAGGTSGLIEMDEGTCHLMLFFPDEDDDARLTLPPVFATIDEAIDWLASNVRHLVVIPGPEESITSYIGLEEDLLLFSGTDDPAVVAAYKMLAHTIDCAKEVECRTPRTSLVFFGSELDKARNAADRIERTASRFMDAKVRWDEYSLQRISGLRPFEDHSIPIPGGFSTRELIEQFREARGEVIEGLTSGRADRWHASREAPDATVDEPVDEPAVLGSTEASEPRYPTHDSLDIDISAEAPREEDAPALESAGDALEQELDEVFEHDERVRAEEARALAETEPPEVPAAPPGPSNHEPIDPPAPIRPIEGSLLALFPGLRPAPVPLSIDARVEVGLDEAGRVHLIAREAQLRELRTAETWVRRNEQLITRAMSIPGFSSNGLRLDLLVDDAAACSDLHGSGLILHLLLPEGATPRVVPLNNERTAGGH